MSLVWFGWCDKVREDCSEAVMVCCWSAVRKGNEWFNDIQLMVTESDLESVVRLMLIHSICSFHHAV